MHLGKQSGCWFNDIVDLELSPSDLETLVGLTEEKALAASTYLEQGIWRALKDKLQVRFDEWRRLRDEQNRKDGNNPSR